MLKQTKKIDLRKKLGKRIYYFKIQNDIFIYLEKANEDNRLSAKFEF